MHSIKINFYGTDNSLIILEQENIPYSLQTIYVGIKNKLLDKPDLEYYVNKTLSTDDKRNKALIQLIIEEYNESALIHCMQQLDIPIPTDNDKDWQIALRTIRYAYLTNLVLHKEYTDETLLEKIAEYYEDINYPQDMEHLIYYMPSKDDYDPSKYSVEYNRKHLISLFEKFLLDEKYFLKK